MGEDAAPFWIALSLITYWNISQIQILQNKTITSQRKQNCFVYTGRQVFMFVSFRLPLKTHSWTGFLVHGSWKKNVYRKNLRVSMTECSSWLLRNGVISNYHLVPAGAGPLWWPLSVCPLRCSFVILRLPITSYSACCFVCTSLEIGITCFHSLLPPVTFVTPSATLSSALTMTNVGYIFSKRVRIELCYKTIGMLFSNKLWSHLFYSSGSELISVCSIRL